MTAWKHSDTDGKDPVLQHEKPKRSSALAAAPSAAPAFRLTASGLSRNEMCIGSAQLPGFSESGAYASIGTAIDEFVQTAARDRAAALKAAPADLRPYLEALNLDAIPAGAEYQVAFAFNAISGEVRRIPGRAEGYPDDLGPEWIFGTSDICGRREDRAFVLDLKWGSSTVGRDPATDLQLAFYGIAAAAIAGADDAEVGFLRAGWDARLRPDSVLLDAFDLAALRARIQAVWRRAQAAGPPRLHIGDWCGYCPARRGCDAMVAPTALVLRGEIPALAALPAAPPDLIAARVRELSLADRGRAYEIAAEIEDRAKAIQAAIRADARLEPVPLSGGKELRETLWGVRKASPAAKAREEALEEELRKTGEVQTVKVPQVRAMAAKKPPKERE